MSQLDLASEAEISTKHLSFLETGRSQPSREMVLHLAEQLEIPRREQNILLVAAGFAPVFRERPLDDPALAAARRAIDLVLKGHLPYPAIAVDRHWTIVASNYAIPFLYKDVAPEILKPPVNALRLALHPKALAPRILNLPEWRAHLLESLRRQIEITADPVLVALMEELRSYPTPNVRPPDRQAAKENFAGVVVPVQFATEHGVLSFFSTITVFGTPVDITLSELALEAFYPADATTAETLRRLGEKTA